MSYYIDYKPTEEILFKRMKEQPKRKRYTKAVLATNKKTLTAQEILDQVE